MNLKIEIVEGAIDEHLQAFALECIRDTHLKHFGVQIDPAIFVDTLEGFARDPKKVFFLARFGDEVVGVVLGQIITYPFTGVKTAVQDYISVVERHRGEGIGIYLIQNFEVWAKQHGCKFVVCGVNELGSHDTNGTNRRFQREDYIHYETSYFKELQ